MLKHVRSKRIQKRCEYFIERCRSSSDNICRDDGSSCEVTLHSPDACNSKNSSPGNVVEIRCRTLLSPPVERVNYVGPIVIWMVKEKIVDDYLVSCKLNFVTSVRRNTVKVDVTYDESKNDCDNVEECLYATATPAYCNSVAKITDLVGMKNCKTLSADERGEESLPSVDVTKYQLRPSIPRDQMISLPDTPKEIMKHREPEIKDSNGIEELKRSLNSHYKEHPNDRDANRGKTNDITLDEKPASYSNDICPTTVMHLDSTVLGRLPFLPGFEIV